VRRGGIAWAAVALVGVLGACEEQSPTSLDPDDVPARIRTVEVEIPWAEFGTTLESYPGFGAPSDIGVALVADAYQGVLDSRALLRFPSLPRSTTVRDSSGALVRDTLATVEGGRIVFDVIVPPGDSTSVLDFTASALSQRWDRFTATWESAIDSVGETQAWDEPGAGPVRFIGSGSLQLADTVDSVSIVLDAQTIAEWGAADAERSARIDVTTGDARVRLANARLLLDLGSTIDPDTTVATEVGVSEQTFIYTPEPADPDGVIRAGGAPAWRSVFGLDIPTVLNAPAELCEIAGCPYTLTPQALNRASIVLRTRPSPAGFQPRDSVFLDARPVLAPEVLPKSPLGGSFIGSVTLAPEAFQDGGAEPFEVQITNFVTALLNEQSAGSAPTSIALLSTFEPLDASLVEFDGPDDPGAPRLRLLVTVSDRVNFR